ncbi:hypothetical protein BDW59DRAFT_155438 [Aspergillus cavernicola]|uniref:Protein kinase domain-containing protein n=1 Tax=Aspergillus cavernicola TaxID=176166 RepID=A0ABR4H8N4_9EURO
MDVPTEIFGELDRHDGFVGPCTKQIQAGRHDSTCTNFPTSFRFINPAERPDCGRPDSTCTNFPNSFGRVNPAGALLQKEISNEDISHHNPSDGSSILQPNILRTTASQLSNPLQSQKRSSESQSGRGKRLTTSFCADSEPWKLYDKFANLGTSGTTYLALGPLKSSTVAELVVVKEQRAADASATKVLTRIHHENVVSLVDAYLFSGKVFFVYERMDISLARLNACCDLKEEHIAAICREVLEGLKYIHRELKISTHKPLYENTFLNYSGHVKIGHIGTSLLSGPEEQGQQDIHSVGNLMLHIMQRGTMFGNPQEENLQNPHDWSVSILDFWNATKTSPIENLLDHSFLTTVALSRATFAPLVWEADKRVKLHWKKNLLAL